MASSATTRSPRSRAARTSAGVAGGGLRKTRCSWDTGTSFRTAVTPRWAAPLGSRRYEDVSRRYSSAVPNRFYRRRWDESRGDEFDGWCHSVWFFEAGDDGWPVRQVEVYGAGRILRYGPSHQEDRYGGLGEASPYDSGDEWSGFEITKAEFERVWNSDGE